MHEKRLKLLSLPHGPGRRGAEMEQHKICQKISYASASQANSGVN
jgi:hypothetical protein